jgi:hypothetical protein
MKDNQEWISNQGNKYSNHPEGCTDDLRKVKVKLRDGTEKEGEVWRFHWGDYDCPSDIIGYQYLDKSESKVYYSQWLSNEGNTDTEKPKGCLDLNAMVEVVLNDNTTASDIVKSFWWRESGKEYEVKQFRYVFDEEPEFFEEEPETFEEPSEDLTPENENTLKVLECKEEDNGDVTLKLKLGTEALKVLLEQGLRAIIKNAAEEELQRIKESTPEKGTYDK